jgi:hypothetical protein
MTTPIIGRCIGTHAGLNRGVFVKCANCANRHRPGHGDITPALYLDGAGVPQCINFISAGLQAEQPSGSPDGLVPRAADVRVVSPAPVVSSAAFRERAALPQGLGSGAFSFEA